MENARTLELNNILTQQVFRKFVVPSILALIASNISSTIDTIIIGNSLGETGLAAMSLVSPIYLIYFSIGSMIAVGSSIVTGIALGKKDNEQAQRLYFTTFFLALCVGILMTLLGLLSIDGIMGVLGAKGHLLPHVRSYCFYYICGGTFTVLFYVPFNFVRIFGRPKWSMYLLIIVGTCNIVLTLIFVNIFHMGTGGAALATVISLFLAFSVGTLRLLLGEQVLAIVPRLPRLRDIGQILYMGTVAAFNNLSRFLIIFGTNHFIGLYGTATSLTVYTVARNINDLFFMILLGISQAVIPIVSLFYGERSNQQIQIVMKHSLRVGSIIMGVCAIGVIACSRPFAIIFGLSSEYVSESGVVFAITCMALSFNLSYINTLFLNYYSAVKKTGFANVILLCRTMFTLLGTYFFAGISTRYMWVAFILAELCTLVTWFFYVKLRYGKSKSLQEKCIPFWMTEKLSEEANVMEFSLQNTNEDISLATSRLEEFCEGKDLGKISVMQFELALEELLLLVKENALNNGKICYTDVRVVYVKGKITLRLRYLGKRFDPSEYFGENANEGLEDYFGVMILMKYASNVEYSMVLGASNLLITVG